MIPALAFAIQYIPKRYPVFSEVDMDKLAHYDQQLAAIKENYNELAKRINERALEAKQYRSARNSANVSNNLIDNSKTESHLSLYTARDGMQDSSVH